MAALSDMLTRTAQGQIAAVAVAGVALDGSLLFSIAGNQTTWPLLNTSLDISKQQVLQAVCDTIEITKGSPPK